jgi:hypothetical protein
LAPTATTREGEGSRGWYVHHLALRVLLQLGERAGVVLVRDPLLFCKTLSFISYLYLLANQSLVIRTLHEIREYTLQIPSAAS